MGVERLVRWVRETGCVYLQQQCCIVDVRTHLLAACAASPCYLTVSCITIAASAHKADTWPMNELLTGVCDVALALVTHSLLVQRALLANFLHRKYMQLKPCGKHGLLLSSQPMKCRLRHGEHLAGAENALTPEFVSTCTSLLSALPRTSILFVLNQHQQSTPNGANMAHLTDGGTVGTHSR